MGDLLEDFPPDYMDSGNASGDNTDDSDYEERLYSLVHYSQEDAFEVGDNTNSDIFAHVSKGTKVSRLNPVKDIINGNSSPFGDTRSGETDAYNKFLSSDKDLRNLLYSYRNAQSEFSHSTPIKKDHYQNKSLTNSSKQKSVPNKVNENNYIGVGDQSVSDYINVTPPNESVICGRISDCSSLKNIGDTGSKSKGLNCNNKFGHSAGTSFSKSSLSSSEKKKNESVIEIEELVFSKYSMDLKKGKTNTPSPKKHTDSKKIDINESVIVLDDSDSDSNSSILEMEPPVKEPPPIVILSSEDENDKEAVESEKEEEDIMVLYSGGEKSSTVCSTENGQTSGEKSKKKDKEKKKKKNKSVYVTNQDISATSWSGKMSKFYNDSWGGENFDAAKLQLSMSGKRSKWPLVVADLYTVNRANGQRSIKCQKCNHYGHRARCCTEPQKPVVCLYCGVEGHVQTKCPTAICLRCGKPSMVYNFGCHVCSSDRNYNIPCSLCNLTGHHATECPETWRRYHAAITEEDLSCEMETLYKPNNQQHCSNCAGRGHQYHQCDESRQQGNWQKRANSSFREHNMHAKKRKLDEKYPRRGHCHNQKYNKSYNNFLSYFEPLYRSYMR